MHDSIREPARRATGRTLCLIDEPSTGLGAADGARPFAVLQRLVDAGTTDTASEHELDAFRAADRFADPGPAAGAAGAEVVAEAAPAEITPVAASRVGSLPRAMAPLAGVGGGPGRTHMEGPLA